ncbi:hypothetical protein [Corynebacterium flavescens]|uniref:hypothetical protein n=1 Tax=Corynebacterium flavescens TaxID=28028 RepID=UPI00264810A3|nr:hypothetical protein [Corynebacterium flavescens]MDN6199349.1 hypothetical protein [Corynebacterium flavescens]MDN6227420.1 hypothetical protein [Corynebacterium flavescens]MDN6654761.1 hypothetical protein [Bifidobacterium crudilactis]
MTHAPIQHSVIPRYTVPQTAEFPLSSFEEATSKVRAARMQQPTQSIVYETSRDPKKRRVLIDRQSLPLPVDAHVDVQVDPDGSGYVSLRIPAARVQVVEAGKKITSRRPRAQKPASEKKEEV